MPKEMMGPVVYMLSMSVFILASLLVIQKVNSFDNKAAQYDTKRLARAVLYRHESMSWFAHHPKKSITPPKALTGYRRSLRVKPKAPG